ncbi:MAG: cytidine deaminase [Erysipelotrichaceae bacterium]
MEWKQLYDLAYKKINPRHISPFIEAGGVSAAILTKDKNVYVGVCIDTACTLGMCAERNAIANMITNGEVEIVKLVCVMQDGNVCTPCGACREFLAQLHKNSKNLEILINKETEDTVLLKDLMPMWWGESRFDEENKT